MAFSDSWKKLKEGLTKTRDSLFGKVVQLVNSRSSIDADLLEKLEEILISADVGVDTTLTIIDNIKKRVKQEGYDSSSRLTQLLKDELLTVLPANEGSVSGRLLLPEGPRPHVVMVVGVNGAGKTTTIGKLAYTYRKAGYRVVVGAADTFRAAANEQLEIWAKRAGVEIIQQSHGADPGAVAFDAVSSAIAKKAEVVIIDTAGRLHTKTNLMEELKKIRRVLEKRLPGAPHEVLLVLDASTGQNALQQVKHFTAAVEVTGLVLTKLDGTAKGGIVLAISHDLKTPVKFVGVGEQLDDLQVFDRSAFVDALFEGTEISSPNETERIMPDERRIRP
jgi:fused signal recognition particle receptor